MLLDLLTALDFVDSIQAGQSETVEQDTLEDVFSLAGIWKDRDITQESIRKEAWPRQNNNPEQYYGMGRSHK